MLNPIQPGLKGLNYQTPGKTFGMIYQRLTRKNILNGWTSCPLTMPGTSTNPVFQVERMANTFENGNRATNDLKVTPFLGYQRNRVSRLAAHGDAACDAMGLLAVN